MIIQEPVQVNIVILSRKKQWINKIINFSYKVAIWTNLNFYAYEDAIFLAERLCAEGIYARNLNSITQFIMKSV